MKKNIFLLSAVVLMLFISACSDEDEEVLAGSPCTFENAEICSDNGVDILICQSSVWKIKKQCNISIGKKCRQTSDGSLDCLGDGEIHQPATNDDDDDNDDDENNSSSDDAENVSDDVEVSDSDNQEETDSDTGTEEQNEEDSGNSDSDNNIVNDSDNSGSGSNDQDTAAPTDEDTDNNDEETTPDEDENEDIDTGIETPDQDTDTDSSTGGCSSNDDCSGSTPYCSFSTSQCIENAVFITEYVEGESNNRAIEIYNGSKSPINLSNYTLKQANAGSNAESRKDWGKDDSGNISTSFTYTFPLIQLDPDETYTVCNKESVSDLLEKCDDKPATGSTFSFTGNDGLALFEGNTILDQIGTNKTTPTEPWDVAGKEKATEDHTLRRKPEIIQGTTDWAASAGTTEENSEWIVLPKNTFNGLGSR